MVVVVVVVVVVVEDLSFCLRRGSLERIPGAGFFPEGGGRLGYGARGPWVRVGGGDSRPRGSWEPGECVEDGLSPTRCSNLRALREERRHLGR
jgi:hypothetical protein